MEAHHVIWEAHHVIWEAHHVIWEAHHVNASHFRACNVHILSSHYNCLRVDCATFCTYLHTYLYCGHF